MSEIATTQTIINVLSQYPPSLDPLLDEVDELDTWSIEQLKDEVRNLREEVTRLREEGEGVREKGKGKEKKGVKRKIRDDSVGEKKVRKDEETGKRLERARKTELSIAIRAKMRAVIGIEQDDPLPQPIPPYLLPIGSQGSYDIPNWSKPTDPINAIWLERVIAEFTAEITQNPDAHQYARIPPEDLQPDTIRSVARTSFTNYCRRFTGENDPVFIEKRERHVKNRRRWARKDLKQKRRTRASLDPTYISTHPPLPPNALHIEYMSSEYSSAADDSDLDIDTGGTSGEIRKGRREKWDGMGEGVIRGKGWPEGMGGKVLEVRRGVWRSDALNKIYKTLDDLANASSAARSNPNPDISSGTKAGHVAPSHKRFIMPPHLGRRGGRGIKIKAGEQGEGEGEGWMWASGVVGVWPVVQRGFGGERVAEEGGEEGEEVEWGVEGGLADALKGITGDEENL